MSSASLNVTAIGAPQAHRALTKENPQVQRRVRATYCDLLKSDGELECLMKQSAVHISCEYQRAAALIRSADNLLIVAGAGMGVDSGLPDFRGNEGFWRAYPALGRAGTDFFSIASPQAFRSQPRLAWGFYGHRLQLYRETQPHDGFEILRKWGELLPNGAAVFTTNVDGHFQKAGFAPDRITECHGSIHHLQCLEACTTRIWSAEEFLPEVDVGQCLLVNDFPTCPECGGMARPNILMFGDGEWVEHRSHAQWANLDKWLHQSGDLVVVELGAGTTVATARHFTEQMGRRRNASVIRINPQDASIPAKCRNVSISRGATEALSMIDSHLYD